MLFIIKMKYMNEIKNICELLSTSFEKNAWHGPAVMEVIGPLSESDALKKLPNTHSIIELVNHMTAWRVFVERRISGDYTYQVTESLNFPESRDWTGSLRGLRESQSKLLEAVRSFPAERLSEKVPHPEQNYNFNFYTLLHGVIHHDLYHVGQIMLINKISNSPA